MTNRVAASDGERGAWSACSTVAVHVNMSEHNARNSKAPRPAHWPVVCGRGWTNGKPRDASLNLPIARDSRAIVRILHAPGLRFGPTFVASVPAPATSAQRLQLAKASDRRRLYQFRRGTGSISQVRLSSLTGMRQQSSFTETWPATSSFDATEPTLFARFPDKPLHAHCCQARKPDVQYAQTQNMARETCGRQGPAEGRQDHGPDEPALGERDVRH